MKLKFLFSEYFRIKKKVCAICNKITFKIFIFQQLKSHWKFDELECRKNWKNVK